MDDIYFRENIMGYAGMQGNVHVYVYVYACVYAYHQLINIQMSWYVGK